MCLMPGLGSNNLLVLHVGGKPQQAGIPEIKKEGKGFYPYLGNPTITLINNMADLVN